MFPPILRRTFTREKVVGFARTLVYVVPLTILIWVYAEREQIATATDVSVSIDVRAAQPGKLASLQYPAERGLTVEMEGPRSKLEALRQELMTENNGTLVLDIDSGPGTVNLSTARLLSDQPMFKTAGVKVTAAVPSDVTVKIDDVVTRDLTVVAAPGLDFEGTPAFVPPTVKVQGPKSALDRITVLDASGQPAMAVPIPHAGGNTTPGQHDDVEVPIPRPEAGTEGATAVTFTPAAVKTSYRIRDGATDSYLLPSIPVDLVAPAPFLDEYRAQFPATLANVTVRGTPELIQSLKRGTLQRRPKALLELSPDDLPTNTTRKRRLRFDLPEGLTVSPQDQGREVEFTLIHR